MKAYADDLWRRALEALILARHDLPISADGAAARAYYAAFHAVSALFALDGKTYSQHAAVEAAVHRDLVKHGRLAGRTRSLLFRSRRVTQHWRLWRHGARYCQRGGRSNTYGSGYCGCRATATSRV